MAGRGDLGSAQAFLTLASTSPQRRAILEQLRIPFEVVAPTFVEDDEALVTDRHKALDVVRAHALGKARSVHVSGQVTLGVDTTVVLDGQAYAKATDPADAARILRELSGRTHTVISGLCLIAAEEEVVEHAATDVTFRQLEPSAIESYLVSDEWQGRAGAYAIQGLGGRLIERIEGDYLNVVGLPGALLVSLLETRAPQLLSAPLSVTDG